MRRLFGLLMLVAGAAACAALPPAPIEETIFVQVENENIDPVDVTLQCDGARKRIHFMMFGARELRRLVVGRTSCDLLVRVEPAIQGGPYTRRSIYSEVFRSIRGCTLIDVRPKPLLPATFVMIQDIPGCQ